jgi:predicted lactoylglutathione lyase
LRRGGDFLSKTDLQLIGDESVDPWGIINKAIENGAAVTQEKMDLGGFYLAYIVDPVGIHLGLIQYK